MSHNQGITLPNTSCLARLERDPTGLRHTDVLHTSVGILLDWAECCLACGLISPAFRAPWRPTTRSGVARVPIWRTAIWGLVSQAMHWRKIAWIVASKLVPTVGTLAGLVIRALCAVRASKLHVWATDVTTSCRCEWLCSLTACLDRHICTRGPYLICLLRLPTETDHVITRWYIRNLHPVHNTKVEIFFQELRRRARCADNAASASARPKAIQAWNWRREGRTWTGSMECPSRNGSVTWWHWILPPRRAHW